jgi:hypothetical protein
MNPFDHTTASGVTGLTSAAGLEVAILVGAGSRAMLFWMK